LERTINLTVGWCERCEFPAVVGRAPNFIDFRGRPVDEYLAERQKLIDVYKATKIKGDDEKELF
jgi:hypothetical protein